MPSVFNDPPFADDDYEIKLLLHKPKFQKGVMALRQKWDIPSDGFVNHKAHDEWVRQLINDRLYEYRNDIGIFLQILKLTERWHQGVSYYIQTNAPYALKGRPYDPLTIYYYSEDDEEQNIRSVSIEIDKDTTQREVITAFKNAQVLLGVEDVKKQKPKNLDRDLRINELYDDGMKVPEIAEWLNENGYGAFNSDDVHTILKRIKHRLQ